MVVHLGWNVPKPKYEDRHSEAITRIEAAEGAGEGAAMKVRPHGSKFYDVTNHGTSITFRRGTSMQDQQDWAQLTNPDGQGTKTVTSLGNEARRVKED